jgi:hypothetical protein
MPYMPKGMAETGLLNVQHSEFARTQVFDASERSFFAEETWRVLPFAFGPPTNGLGVSSRGLRLLQRYAFPCYKYTAFLRKDDRWLLMTPYKGVFPNCSTKERDSSEFVSSETLAHPGPVDLGDLALYSGPIDLSACGTSSRSNLPQRLITASTVSRNAFSFAERDPLDWSSSIIRVSPQIASDAGGSPADNEPRHRPPSWASERGGLSNETLMRSVK